MKYIISENQNSKIKTKILDSFEDIGVFDTLTRYSLTPKGLDVIFNDDFPEFNCNELRYLFQYFYYKKFYDQKFSYDFNGKTYEVSSYRRGDGVMEYDIKDPENNDGIVVLATPYYEGDCFLPVDVTDYFVINILGEGDTHYEIWTDDTFVAVQPPENFSSFSEFFNWFKDDAMLELFEFVIPLLEMTRDKYENDKLY
jgi:hypothetical protein